MEGLQLLSYEILKNVGEAKQLFLSAMKNAREGNFEESSKLISDGEVFFLEGHRAHMQMISESGNDSDKINLLMAHAEDQLMNTDTIKLIALEMIENYRLHHNG